MDPKDDVLVGPLFSLQTLWLHQGQDAVVLVATPCAAPSPLAQHKWLIMFAGTEQSRFQICSCAPVPLGCSLLTKAVFLHQPLEISDATTSAGMSLSLCIILPGS